MVSGSWQFPPSQLNQQERFQAHSPQKELSRRGRSLHQELFLSRESRDNQEDEESNRLSQAPPFARILEHSWQPEVGDSICSSQFVPNICVCSSGDLGQNLLVILTFVASGGLLHLSLQPQTSYISSKPGKASAKPRKVHFPVQGKPPTKHQTLLGFQLLLPRVGAHLPAQQHQQRGDEPAGNGDRPKHRTAEASKQGFPFCDRDNCHSEECCRLAFYFDTAA